MTRKDLQWEERTPLTDTSMDEAMANVQRRVLSGAGGPERPRRDDV